MKNFLVGVMLFVLVAGLPVAAQDAQTPQAICDAAATDEPATRDYSEPEQVLEDGVDYRAVLCTSAGAIYVDLFENEAPTTVNSFVFLAENGFYNNTMFHRVIEDFMAQAGDPTGTGAGGPGYQFEDEFVGFLTFDRPGWLAMANANRPEQGIVGTNGSQFFITTVPTPHLDFRHTIFGEVLEGDEAVANIDLRDPQTASDPGTALNTVVIVTDPATVETTYVGPEVAPREEVEAVLTSFGEDVPEGISYSSAFQTTDEVSGTLSDEADWLASHNHEYRATGHIESCDTNVLPVSTIRYTLDRFASVSDATAALNDPALADIAAADDLTASESEELTTPLYTGPATACDADATHALTRWQRGHFVVTAEVVLPNGQEVPLDRVLRDYVGASIFEPALTDVLRAELRQS